MLGPSGDDAHIEPTQQPVRRWALAVHRPLRWGVAGTGLIAEDMMSVASMIPGVVIQAVGARKDEDKANAFAQKHGASLLWRLFGQHVW